MYTLHIIRVYIYIYISSTSPTRRKYMKNWKLPYIIYIYISVIYKLTTTGVGLLSQGHKFGWNLQKHPNKLKSVSARQRTSSTTALTKAGQQGFSAATVITTLWITTRIQSKETGRGSKEKGGGTENKRQEGKQKNSNRNFGNGKKKHTFRFQTYKRTGKQSRKNALRGLYIHYTYTTIPSLHVQPFSFVSSPESHLSLFKEFRAANMIVKNNVQIFTVKYLKQCRYITFALGTVFVVVVVVGNLQYIFKSRLGSLQDPKKCSQPQHLRPNSHPSKSLGSASLKL